MGTATYDFLSGTSVFAFSPMVARSRGVHHPIGSVAHDNVGPG